LFLNSEVISPENPCPVCGGRHAPTRLGANCPTILLQLGMAEPTLDDTHDPRVLGGYELLEPIAEGGMGKVFRARHPGLGRMAAVKVIHGGRLATPAAVRRFYVEAKAAAGMDHPNIVPVFEVGEDDGRHFLVMKEMTGGSLADLIGRLANDGRRMDPLKVAQLAAKIARAIAFAHERGVLHRDIKPANILLDDRGEPHVADFGLARLDDGTAGETLGDVVAGTPAYLAPEVAKNGAGSTTTASDVYSLGALLYELLAGRPPFSGPTPFETLRVAADQDPPPLRLGGRMAGGGGGGDLEAICRRCLAKHPSDRYTSATALADDLERWLAGDPVSVARNSMWRLVVSWARRRPAVSTAVAASVISLSGGGYMAVRQARLTSLNLYAADLKLASDSMRDGDLGTAREALQRHAGHNPDFVWRYLSSRCADDASITLGRHPWIVTALAWSPDGRWLLSGSAGSGTVGDDTRLWSTSGGGGEVLFDRGARSIQWLPDSSGFFAAHSDGSVRRWAMPARKTVAEYPGLTCSLSADGRKLACCDAFPFQWEAPGTVVIRSVESGAVLMTIPDARLASLSPDGSKAAVTDLKQSIRILDLNRGATIAELPLERSVWSMVFTPDGHSLAITGWDRDVRIWRIAGPEAGSLSRWKGHTLPTWGAGFNPSGGTLATTASDQSVRLWDVASGTEMGVLRGHDSEVWCAAFSPDGSKLATGGKDTTVRLWKLGAGESRMDWRPDLDADIFFTSNGRLHFTTMSAAGEKVAASVDPLSPSSPLVVEPKAFVHGFHGGAGNVFSMTSTGVLGRWTMTGEMLSGDIRLQGGPGTEFQRWSVSPDGRLVGALGRGGALRVWETRSGTLVGSADLGEIMTLPLAWSPDGRVLGVAAGEPGAWLVGSRGGAKLHLASHKDEVKAVVFLNNNIAATASVDGTVKLWNARSGTELETLRACRTSADSMDLSPDGRILAIGESEVGVHFWRLDVMREVAFVEEPLADFLLRFSPDGNALIVGLRGGQIRSLTCPQRKKPAFDSAGSNSVGGVRAPWPAPRSELAEWLRRPQPDAWPPLRR
jgi:eukaryotic-like serine/threonine-protein kinase